MERYWSTLDDRAVLEVFFTAAGLGHYMVSKTLECKFGGNWRFHDDLPINAAFLDGTRLSFVSRQSEERVD